MDTRFATRSPLDTEEGPQLTGTLNRQITANKHKLIRVREADSTAEGRQYTLARSIFKLLRAFWAIQIANENHSLDDHRACPPLYSYPLYNQNRVTN